MQLWLVHPDPEICEAFHFHFDDLPEVRVCAERMEALPPHDCFVTAANSFGIMDGGIDAVVVRFHGEELMRRIQRRILDEYRGEQPVGTCLIEHTDKADYPFVGHAPTMRVPGSILGTDNVYLATWGALLAIERHNQDQPQKIHTVAMPMFGAGYGEVPPHEAARQMAVAYRNYLQPPHRLDADFARHRHQQIVHDGQRRVVR